MEQLVIFRPSRDVIPMVRLMECGFKFKPVGVDETATDRVLYRSPLDRVDALEVLGRMGYEFYTTNGNDRQITCLGKNPYAVLGKTVDAGAQIKAFREAIAKLQQRIDELEQQPKALQSGQVLDKIAALFPTVRFNDIYVKGPNAEKYEIIGVDINDNINAIVLHARLTDSPI